MALNVFLIEKQEQIRNRIQQVLNESPPINFVGAATHYVAEATLVDASIDVLLLELDLPLQQALLLMKKIFKDLPRVKIIFLSDQPDSPAFLRKLLEGGASGYMTKNAGKQELAYGTEKVYLGGLYICTAFILKVLSRFEGLLEQDFEGIKDYNISVGEMEVLKLIAEGHTNKDIAQELHISVRTVEARRKSLLEKTDTTNTATLMRFAIKAGLIS